MDAVCCAHASVGWLTLSSTETEIHMLIYFLKIRNGIFYTVSLQEVVGNDFPKTLFSVNSSDLLGNIVEMFHFSLSTVSYSNSLFYGFPIFCSYLNPKHFFFILRIILFFIFFFFFESEYFDFIIIFRYKFYQATHL